VLPLHLNTQGYKTNIPAVSRTNHLFTNCKTCGRYVHGQAAPPAANAAAVFPRAQDQGFTLSLGAFEAFKARVCVCLDCEHVSLPAYLAIVGYIMKSCCWFKGNLWMAIHVLYGLREENCLYSTCEPLTISVRLWHSAVSLWRSLWATGILLWASDVPCEPPTFSVGTLYSNPRFEEHLFLIISASG